MNLLHELSLRGDDGQLRMVVEVAKGSSVKLKYDGRLGAFIWSRTLTYGVKFPYDFGFFPQTLAEDGDALDAFVYADESTQPGVVVPARAIGALRVEQRRSGRAPRRNDRVLVVPLHDTRSSDFRDIGQITTRTRTELEAFFDASLALTGKRVKFRGWADAAETRTIIEESHARYMSRRRRRS